MAVTSEAMTSDLYKDARVLSSRLRTSGRDEWAARIEDDIAAGSTGTEILMRLRATVKDLTKAELSLPNDVRSRTDRLFSSINNALQ